jgi:hypothetical protein
MRNTYKILMVTSVEHLVERDLDGRIILKWHQVVRFEDVDQWWASASLNIMKLNDYQLLEAYTP